jgi:HEAT repeat protein
VAFSIAPRDEGALRAKAAKLTQVVMNAPTAQERINAERILTAIVDPVVVPFLAEVLERTTVSDYAAIHALGRIGSPEAMKILQSAAASPNEERAAIARDTISRPEADR